MNVNDSSFLKYYIRCHTNQGLSQFGPETLTQMAEYLLSNGVKPEDIHRDFNNCSTAADDATEAQQIFQSTYGVKRPQQHNIDRQDTKRRKLECTDGSTISYSYVNGEISGECVHEAVDGSVTTYCCYQNKREGPATTIWPSGAEEHYNYENDQREGEAFYFSPTNELERYIYRKGQKLSLSASPFNNEDVDDTNTGTDSKSNDVEKETPTISTQSEEQDIDLDLQENYLLQELKLAEDNETKGRLHQDLALHYRELKNFKNEMVEWENYVICTSNSNKLLEVGKTYLFGLEGVKINLKLACKYFRKGSRSYDNAICRYYLGVTYDKRRGMENSKAKRMRYLELAKKYYTQISKFTSTTHFASIESKFNALYLDSLNDEGSFAPKNIKLVGKELTQLRQKNKTCPRIPLIQALIFFLKNIGTEANREKVIKKHLTIANENGSKIAKSLLQLDYPSLKTELMAYVKDPEPLYSTTFPVVI